MGRTERNSNFYLERAKLMEKILEIRYTDLNQEKELCKKLLEISKLENDMYGCAFGNVYMFDSLLALGDYKNCDEYLIQGKFLCTRHGYDDLRLILDNFAGLYYIKLNDELSAIQYYQEGLSLAKHVGDYDTESKILNNIGFGFGGRGDWTTSREYFERAFKTIEPYIDESNFDNAISYLCNAAEASKSLGDSKTCRRLLEKCEKLSGKGIHHQFRIGCGWCSYYAVQKDKENCIKVLDHLLKLGLLEYENKYFVCDMLEGLFYNLLDLDVQERTRRILDILGEMETDTSLVNRYRIELAKVQYYEKYDRDELNASYKRYYELERTLASMDDQTRAQSMTSKIQIANALAKMENMYRENQELFDASQLDGLTGLYNRRYFNKLVSKVIQDKTVKTLGYIMMDVDYFKGYNDHYGHVLGDEALKTVARILSDCACEGIHASRFGGDEFVCLCVNLPDDAVQTYVERVRRCLREQKIAHTKSKCSGELTLSIGYCNEPVTPDLEIGKLLELADHALYKVKQKGRNGSARLKQEN